MKFFFIFCMIEPVSLATTQKLAVGQQSKSLKNEWKEGTQMQLSLNIKLLFLFIYIWKHFSDFVSKQWTLARHIVNQIGRPDYWTT